MPFKISLRNRANKNGKCNIVCTYRYKQEPRFQFPAKNHSGESIAIPCEYWNKERARVKKSYETAIIINKRLSEIEQEAERILQQIFIERRPPHVSVFRQKWESENKDSTFFEAWEDFKKYKKRSRTSKASLANYKALEIRLQDFQKINGTIHFSQLDQNFIDSYSDFVLNKISKKTGRKLKPATLQLDLRILKVFLKHSLNRKSHSNNSFQFWETISVSKKKGPDSWLLPIEVFKIKHLTLSGKVKIYRDVFLMMCATGLRISEYKRLKNSDLDRRLNLIQYGKSKNKNSLNKIIVGSEVIEFFEKYPELPQVTTQQMNAKYLPMIAELAGIDKHITTHFGRRTCVNISNLAGIPISEISKTVGHSSEDITKGSYQDDMSVKPAIGPKLLEEYMKKMEKKTG